MHSLQDIQRYVLRDCPAGIVDTEVTILLLIGHFDPAFIERCGLTANKRFTAADFELLKKTLRLFKKIVITPHVIAEISNLSRRDMKGDRLVAYFWTVLPILVSTDEQHVKLQSLLGIKIEVLSNFGLTDMSLFELSRQN